MRLLVLVAVLVPGLAAAQAPRDMATVCNGRPTGDDLTACGMFLLDAYNRAPGAPDGDQHLYNAGVMLAEGHAISAAIQSFTLLRRSFPRSKLAPRALARTGMLYAQIVMLDRAAEALEQYAAMYAGEKDAYDALSDAIYYRRALGDDAKAIEQTKFFVRMYGAKKPIDAAAAMFALTSVYEKRRDGDATLKHLSEYVRSFGAKGGKDRLVIAYAKIGALQWQASCPVPQIDGACIRITRPARGAVCGAVRVERVARVERTVKDALAAFASATKTYEQMGGKTGGDEASARYYYAQALLRTADAAAEAMPISLAPRGAKLDAWTTEQVTARGKVLAKYEAILAVKDSATSIAAAERIARLSEDLAGAIVATAARASECEAVATAAAPFRQRAIEGYAVCLAKAAELEFFEEPARACEVALARLAPAEFPPLRERLGRPAQDTVLAVEGP